MLQTFWLVLTYSYNVILVLFIATHLFVGAIISFLTGMYMGVYLTQNYEIPKINDPRLVWEKFLAFLEKNRKNPQKASMGNLLRPSTLKELMVEVDALSSSSSSYLQQPSHQEGESIAEKSKDSTFTYTESHTKTEDEEEVDYENDDINMISTENELVDPEEVSEKTDTATLEANSMSEPIRENATTLILTDPEDLIAEDLKSISSPQIVEASLTLDKDKAISRSWNKLNF